MHRETQLYLARNQIHNKLFGSRKLSPRKYDSPIHSSRLNMVRGITPPHLTLAHTPSRRNHSMILDTMRFASQSLSPHKNAQLSIESERHRQGKYSEQVNRIRKEIACENELLLKVQPQKCCFPRIKAHKKRFKSGRSKHFVQMYCPWEMDQLEQHEISF